MALTTTTKSIANEALSLIGGKLIVTFDEDTVSGRLVSAFYTQTLEDILAEHPWTFAQKRAELTDDDTDPTFTDDLMTVTYSRPADMIKLNFVNIRNARIKLEGDKILSDTEDLYALYTYNNTNPTTYFSKFTSAFVMLLAAKMAYGMTDGRTLSEQLLKTYLSTSLPTAISADSQQGTPQVPIQNNWLGARTSGGGDLVGQTSWETWYPVNWY